MKTTAIRLTTDEIEDIRFALALVAQQDEDRAQSDLPEIRYRALVQQAVRFRALARKVSGTDIDELGDGTRAD